MGYNSLIIKRNLEKNKIINLKDNEISLIESNIPVLIEGETGTGKTRLAKEIHKVWNKDAPFVHINISSFANNLMESELFGHIKGAFTGAVYAKNGAFREADGGTLFIDEIDSLPLELQTKLLIFLDEKKFRQVGASKDLKINCRLIFASGRNLEGLVAKKEVRKDFYYRLNSGLKISLKPLREDLQNMQDIYSNFELENNVYLTEELKEFYKTLPWPGNIRQLINHLDKKKLITSGPKLDFDEYDEKLMFESTDLIDLDEHIQNEITMDELKYKYIQKLLAKYKNNKTAVSKILGITPRSIKNICDKNNYEAIM